MSIEKPRAEAPERKTGEEVYDALTSIYLHLRDKSERHEAGRDARRQSAALHLNRDLMVDLRSSGMRFENPAHILKDRERQLEDHDREIGDAIKSGDNEYAKTLRYFRDAIQDEIDLLKEVAGL